MSVRIVLASGSARRQDILELLGLEFEIRAPDVDETPRDAETAEETAVRLARAKVDAVPRTSEELVLAADTLVVVDRDVLGKPAGAEEAEDMIALLSGGMHMVLTGIALAWRDRVAADVARTAVQFRASTESEIAEYVATGESLDKAGAYGIQGLGAALVERIDGDFYNVMGLPVPTFIELLDTLGLGYRFGRPASIEVRASNGSGP